MPETPLELTQSVRDISVTERNSFKGCRRRWLLETIENLEPRGVRNWNYDFGTGLHEGLEGYYRTLGGLPVNDHIWESPLDAALAKFEAWVGEMDREIVNAGLGDSTSAFRNELMEYKELGEGMLTNYSIYAPMVDDFIVVCVEGEFTKRGLELLGGELKPPYAPEAHTERNSGLRLQVPIIDPATGKALPGRPLLSSRLDLIGYREKTGLRGFWVYDHKSAGSSPNDRALDFDDQVTGYGYNFWRYTGIYARGTVFNYLIKDLPAGPRWVQENKSNPVGLSYAKDQATTPDLYKEALEEAGYIDSSGRVTYEKHAECYASLRARGWDRWFKRFEPKRNEHEYKMFELRLPHEYKDMLDVYENPADLAYPHLSQYNCGGCPVGPICQAIEDGSDYDLVVETRFQQASDRKAK